MYLISMKIFIPRAPVVHYLSYNGELNINFEWSLRF